MNTLLLELAGVDIKLSTHSTPLALNISWIQTQNYSILLSGACVRFLMTQPKRIHKLNIDAYDCNDDDATLRQIIQILILNIMNHLFGDKYYLMNQ